MSLFKIRRDRTKYTAPVVKLCISLAVVIAAKFGESLVDALYNNRYHTVARVVFCVVAAVCAILCYQALMEIGYVYDNRNPNAAASVGAEDMTVGEVMNAIESDVDVRVALLVGGDKTLVVGARPKSVAEEDFTRVYFAGGDELENADALCAKLEEIAKDGKLSVAAVGELTGRKFVKALRRESAKEDK